MFQILRPFERYSRGYVPGGKPTDFSEIPEDLRPALIRELIELSLIQAVEPSAPDAARAAEIADLTAHGFNVTPPPETPA